MRTYGKKYTVLILEESPKGGVVGNAIQRLVDELEDNGTKVIRATSFDDCYSILLPTPQLTA